jgi:CRP-like cAMP-binding protein
MASGFTGLLGKEYKDGEIIFRQGDRGDCMYVIQGGEVEIVHRKGDKEYCLDVLGEGDFFGEMGLFEEEVRSVTARAAGRVWIYTPEKTMLLRRIHEDPSLAFRVIERMSRRIRRLETAVMKEAEAPA